MFRSACNTSLKDEVRSCNWGFYEITVQKSTGTRVLIIQLLYFNIKLVGTHITDEYAERKYALHTFGRLNHKVTTIVN